MTEQLIKQIEEEIFGIEKKIRLISKKDLYPSLMGSSGGIILFYFYLYRLTGDEKYNDLAFKTLEFSLNNIGAVSSGSLAGGLTGIFYLLSICYDERFIDDAPEVVLKDGIEIIHRWMINELIKGNLDYLHGGLGCYKYLLSQKKEGRLAIPDLLHPTELIIEHSTTSALGTWWGTFNKNTDKYEKQLYNLGISHGNLSIQYALSLAQSIGLLNNEFYSKLLNAVTMMMDLIIEPMENGFYFPYSMDFLAQRQRKTSRLAWCYGDLGNSIMLINMSKLLDHSTLLSWAKKIAANTLVIPSDLTGVADSSICHGLLGNANIYNLLSSLTGDHVFKARANELYTIHCSKLFPSRQYHRYTFQYGKYYQDSSLLEGITGMGLSLISALNNDLVYWNKPFLTIN